jgi:diguanylate cyclase (GGDEF)-like protein/PAS domain S-box-containing protein
MTPASPSPPPSPPGAEMRMAAALTWRYVVALVLVALLSTGAWFSLQLVIETQTSSAALVNISGRQRMLSQRTALFATQLAQTQGMQSAALQQELAAATTLMTQSHQGLIHGNPTLGLPATQSDTVRRMYFEAPGQLNARVTTYTALLEQWLALPAAERHLDHPVLQRITAAATGDLLTLLDQMVGQYQREGETAVRLLQRTETGLWLATLLLLVLEAGLIFHPFVRHMREVVDKLERKRATLRQQRDTLEQAVQARTADLQHRLQDLEVRDTALQLIPQGVLFSGPDRRIVYANPGFEQTTGYPKQDIVGQSCRILQGVDTDPATAEAIAEALAQTQPFRGTVLNYRKDGRPFWNDLSICPAKDADAQLIGFVAVLHDVSDLKLRESTYWTQAHHDALTGLPNRLLLADRWHQVVARCARYRQHGALLFLDLDRFKALNDQHGHEYGDQLLIQVSQRLGGVVRDVDTVVRLGGDEFVVLLSELNEHPARAEQEARQVIKKIKTTLAKPFYLTPNAAPTNATLEWRAAGASVGLALFGGMDTHLDSVLQAADQAMYSEKPVQPRRPPSE